MFLFIIKIVFINFIFLLETWKPKKTSLVIAMDVNNCFYEKILHFFY